jgi:hypothetical protein
MGYRSASAPNELEGMENILKKYCHVLNAKAGQIILFDNALIHGSLPNSSGQVRVALTGGIYPKPAPLVTSVIAANTPSGTVDIYEVNEAYFSDMFCGKDVSNQNPLGKDIGNYPLDQLNLSPFEWELSCRLNRFLLPQPFKPGFCGSNFNGA